MATSRNSCETEKSKPTLTSSAALTLQNSHTEKPRCSAKIDQIRLRRATGAPSLSQNSASSGRQSSIHRPVRRPDEEGAGGAVTDMGDSCGFGGRALSRTASAGDVSSPSRGGLGDVNLSSPPHNRVLRDAA
jgi:hypothetical protein